MTQQYIYGIHTVTAALQTAPQNISKILIQPGRRVPNIEALARKNNIVIQVAVKTEIDKLLPTINHQGVVAIVLPNNIYHEHDLNKLLDNLTEPPFLLILDGVQDPHNLGACLRSANAAGVHVVIAPKDNAVGLTPAVRKVASGAAEITPFIQVTNLARTLRSLKERGIWLYGAAMEAKNSIYNTDLPGPVALVLGAEGKGLRRLTKDHCDDLISIPMLGMVSSLNVSVAAGICLFEAVRQRKIAGEGVNE